MIAIASVPCIFVNYPICLCVVLKLMAQICPNNVFGTNPTVQLHLFYSNISKIKPKTSTLNKIYLTFIWLHFKSDRIGRKYRLLPLTALVIDYQFCSSDLPRRYTFTFIHGIETRQNVFHTSALSNETKRFVNHWRVMNVTAFELILTAQMGEGLRI